MQQRSQPDLKQGCCVLRVKHLNAAHLQLSGEKNCRLTTLFQTLGSNAANVGPFFFLNIATHTGEYIIMT